MADVSGLTGVGADLYKSAISKIYSQSNNATKATSESDNDSFSQIFSSALNLINETDSLAAKAEKAEIDFSLGNADNTHDVTIAQQKAYLSLQYTVAVKNALLEAYKEIMNIQI